MICKIYYVLLFKKVWFYLKINSSFLKNYLRKLRELNFILEIRFQIVESYGMT